MYVAGVSVRLPVCLLLSAYTHFKLIVVYTMSLGKAACPSCLHVSLPDLLKGMAITIMLLIVMASHAVYPSSW